MQKPFSAMAVCPNCHQQNPELGAACPRCKDFYYVADDALHDAEQDRLIGRLAADKYVILSLISEGGMGAVYRALQLPVEREVAFKVLRTELEDSDQGRDRFIREARAVSRLNHPNIITLHDFGFDEKGHPYMVMEYAPGQSLHEWLRRGDLTLERILHVVEQVLSALTEAHRRGIVHRDLKPENMIVSPTGNDRDFIKLLDFGIARMLNEGTRGLTREGEVFGTPHYMAPEQAQGKKNVGPPVDVYAMGILMFEMLSGRCPFDADTPLAVLFMHIHDELPRLEPRPGLPPIPRDLQSVVARATAKDQKERFQTAGEMLTTLSGFTNNYFSGRFTPVPPASRSQQRDTFADPPNGSGEAQPSFDQTQPSGTGSRLSRDRSTSGPHGVPVYDPEAGPEPALPPEGIRKKRVILLGGALIALMIVATGGIVVALSSSNSEPIDEAVAEEATEPMVEETEPRAADEGPADQTESAAEIAARKTMEASTAAELAVDQSDEEVDAAAANEEEAEAKEDEAEVKEETKPAAKEETTRRRPKRRTRKPRRKSESEKTEPAPKKFQPRKFQPTEKKTEPKKFEPRKFE